MCIFLGGNPVLVSDDEITQIQSAAAERAEFEEEGVIPSEVSFRRNSTSRRFDSYFLKFDCFALIWIFTRAYLN